MKNANEHATVVHARDRWPKGVVTLLAAALLVAGCDSTPTEPGLTIDAAEQAAAVQEVWSDLPSSMELEAEAWTVVEADAVEGEAAFAILDAGDLAAEAGAATDLGAEEDADRLAEAADSLALRGFLAALGPQTADAVLDRIERARARLRARFGATVGGELAVHLADADAELDLAADARAASDHAGVLYHAGRASDALRWLDPEAKAKAAVARAWVLLDYAQRLAGDDPEAPIARALARANQLCVAARAAVDADRWRVAVLEARACARLSRAVIARLGAGVDPDLLAERAEEAVSHAAGLLERATEMAGAEPEPRVEELLSEAEALLGRAEVALEEARFRAAIGLSIESSARSLRVLRILWDGDPSPYELRAIAAVEVGLALEARGDSKIGDDTSPEIVETDQRADALLREAEEALASGAYRVAWVKARTAVAVYTRILLALA